MARTEVALNRARWNSGIEVTPVDIDVANGNTVLADTDDRFCMVITNAAATAKVVRVQSKQNGDGLPPAVETIPAGGTMILGPFESSRFKQRDGYWYIDYEEGMTGTIMPIHLPK